MIRIDDALEKRDLVILLQLTTSSFLAALAIVAYLLDAIAAAMILSGFVLFFAVLVASNIFLPKSRRTGE